MTFQPGNNANPNGRPKGARNRRTQEIIDLLQSRGDKDPLDFLSEVISSMEQYPAELKVTAANYLTPYLHSKRGTAPAPRFIDTPIVVPEFHSVQEAEAYLASLPVLLGKGELDCQSALELSTQTRNWLSAIYEHQEFDLRLQAQGGGSEQTIHITGGLPPLPGSNVIGMGGDPGPQPNGHSVNGHGPVIDHVEPTPFQSIPQLKDVTR
jgi:hypothetical protein